MVNEQHQHQGMNNDYIDSLIERILPIANNYTAIIHIRDSYLSTISLCCKPCITFSMDK